MNSEKFSDLNNNRSSTYAFFSRIFGKEVNNEIIANMLGDDFIGYIRDIKGSQHGSEMAEGAKMLEKYLSAIDEKDIDKVIEELSVDYARLFLLAGGVHPYESVHLGKEGLVMEKPWEEVREAYRKAGLAKGEKEKEPEDHIAMELAFMSYLCDEEEFRTQKEFLDEHLLKWIPKFCDDVAQKAESEFYRGIAKLTKGFLQLEPDLMNEAQG